jgi:hypothetical protein
MRTVTCKWKRWDSLKPIWQNIPFLKKPQCTWKD